jgi:hypothetical protein
MRGAGEQCGVLENRPRVTGVFPLQTDEPTNLDVSPLMSRATVGGERSNTMTETDVPEQAVLSLVAAGREEAVPSGVPMGRLALASLQSPEVEAWLDRHREYAVYVVAGREHASEGVPALTVPATPTDYRLVLSEMPR